MSTETTLDSKSIEVISRFKQAVIDKLQAPRFDAHLLDPNRGRKISDDDLKTKVVEYNGNNYVVTTNENIEKSGNQNKRKWNEYYKNTEEFKRLKSEGQEQEGEFDEDDHREDDSGESDEEPENPLEGLNVTDILLPLIHPSEIVSHASILKTYKLDILSKLAEELIITIEIEQTTLNWFNKLLQVLNGEDWFFLLEDQLGLPKYDHGLVSDDKDSEKDSEEPSNGQSQNDDNEVKQENDSEPPKRITRTNNLESDEVSDPFFMLPETLKRYEAHHARVIEEPESGHEEEYKNVQEDLINYLQVSIQRQQEYIKNLTKLRMNLIRADRLKSNLYKWAKEMYDKKST